MPQGRLLAERKTKEGKAESGLVGPGSLLGCAAFLSSSRSREAVRAAETCSLAVFGPQELENLLVRSTLEQILSQDMKVFVAKGKWHW